MYKWNDIKGKIESIEIIYSMSTIDQKTIWDLVKDAKKESVFVEIGIAHGRTAALLTYIADHQGCEYYGIDNFSLGSNANEVRTSLDMRGLKNYSIIEAKSQDVGWHKPIDVLIIDGAHDEPSVKADYEKWLPFVKKGGLVFVDDWGDEVGAHKGITIWGKEYMKDWKVISKAGSIVGSRMEVRRKPR